jgi:hypothetical protein
MSVKERGIYRKVRIEKCKVESKGLRGGKVLE